MRLTLAALALLATIATANAGFTCYRMGSYVTCTDYSSGQTTRCYRMGNFVTCN